MSPSPLPRFTIFNTQPAHIAEIPNLGPDHLQQHQNPLIDWVDQHHELPLGVLLNSLSNPGGRTFLPALMDNRPKGRVDVVRGSPLTSQTIKAFWEWVGTWVKCEMEFSIQWSINVRGSDPVVLAIVAIAFVKFIGLGLELALMRHQVSIRPSNKRINNPIRLSTKLLGLRGEYTTNKKFWKSRV